MTELIVIAMGEVRVGDVIVDPDGTRVPVHSVATEMPGLGEQHRTGAIGLNLDRPDGVRRLVPPHTPVTVERSTGDVS